MIAPAWDALPRALRPPPPGVSWGRRGSVYNFDTVRFLNEFMDDGCLRLVQVVARTLDRQIAEEGGGMSLGAVTQEAGVFLGASQPVARRCGVVVDVLQMALDLADNVADEELDRQQGRALDTSYPGVCRESLVALPALLVGAVVAGLHSNFARPFDAGYAVGRLMEVLAVLTRGQALDLDDPRRLDMISGVEGRLFALPWWLAEGPATTVGLQVETWGVAYARTWQARRDVMEHGHDSVYGQRYREARQRASVVWPRQCAPFAAGGFFDLDRAVPEHP